MDNREYKKLRQAIMEEYSSGILTLEELREKLLDSTNIYRKANNIAKAGSNLVLSVSEKDMNIYNKRSPKDELYFLYKEKKMANLPDYVIAQMLNIGRTVLSRRKNVWIEMGWLKVAGQGRAQEVIFYK